MLDGWIASAAVKYGLAGFFSLMVIQTIVAPIPSEGVLMLGGVSFGFVLAGLVGGLGEIAGGTVGFLLARRFGRGYVEKVIGKSSLAVSDRWFAKHGAKAVLAGRLTPMIPSDLISYSAGLTSIDFNSFMNATVIGGIPRAFFYAYLGAKAAEGLSVVGLESTFTNAMLAVAALFVVLTAVQHKLQGRVMER